jgi:hypothetical protein
MPLTGEYEPSQTDRSRKQGDLYEATNSVKGGAQNGKPTILLASRDAKSSKTADRSPNRPRDPVLVLEAL